MIDFIINYGIFMGGLVATVLALVIWIFSKFNWKWDDFVNHWKTTGDGAWGSIFKAIAVVTALAVVIGVLTGQKAEAGWFEYTELYAGVESTMDVSPMCDQSDIDDRVTSNIGIRQHVYSWRDISLVGNYTHHSCAVGVDNEGYDALGLQFTWRF